MKEAGLGIEAAAFAGGSTVVGEHSIEKGKKGVCPVKRRALGSAFNLKTGVLSGQHLIEDCPVRDGGIAFDSPKRIERSCTPGGLGSSGKRIDSGLQLGGAISVFQAVITGGSLKDRAGVVKLSLDHVPGDFQGGRFVLGPAILFTAKKDVAGNPTVGRGEELSERREE